MRDPEVMATLASLLENLASTSHRPRAVQRRKSKQQQIQAIRDALIESYPTLDSLVSLFERLGFGHHNYTSVADAHGAILAEMSTADDAERIAREVLGEATRIGGELEQLTKAIVTKRRQ
jgi:hypothetical protein